MLLAVKINLINLMDKKIIYFGRAEPPQEPLRLNAGDLAMVFEDGAIKDISFAGEIVLRSIYVAVRDHNWGTIENQISDLQVKQKQKGFEIIFHCRNFKDSINFTWKGRIRAKNDGSLVYEMDGEAQSTFMKNRIGFCVLYPSTLAGKSCVLLRQTDMNQEEVKTCFPEFICSEQPLDGFSDVKSTRHEFQPGQWAEVGFEGESFEMEDQRNWTDASFKVYGTPLNHPYPVRMAEGDRVEQKVNLRIHPGVSSKTRGATITASEIPVRLTLGLNTEIPLAEIGVNLSVRELPLSDVEVQRTLLLNLNHLRVDFDLSEQTPVEWITKAVDASNLTRLPLEIALFIKDGFAQPLIEFRRLLGELNPVIRRWLVYAERESYTGGTPLSSIVGMFKKIMGDYKPEIPFGTGTNTDFIFLLRNLPPVNLVDFITISINPQVHAFDHDSLMQTIQVQYEVVRNARRITGIKPVVVSPVTLKPRFNPYASEEKISSPSGMLPSNVDERQSSLFTAAWTLGSVSSLNRAGAASITFFELSGWRGIMDRGTGSPLPDQFFSIPGSVYPVYLFLSSLAGFHGGSYLPFDSTSPGMITGFGVRSSDRMRIFLANITRNEHKVELANLLPGDYTASTLDEKNVLSLMRNPESFFDKYVKFRVEKNRLFYLDMMPYSMTVIDF